MSYDDEDKYSDIPPTKLRNREEKFRKVHLEPFWCWFADVCFFHMIENRFYGIRVKSKENYEKRNPNYANIVYAPHFNWWDGITGYYICAKTLKSSIRMMVEEANKFPLFTKAGGFPVNKRSAQTAMKALNYATELLEDKNITLWTFPQGIVKPPNFRPIEFQTGMAYMADKVVKKGFGVNMIPAAVNYAFLRQDKPEVFVEFGEPIIIDKDHPLTMNRKDFTHKLQEDFTKMCDEQLHAIQTGDIDGYELIYHERPKWQKRLERWLKKIPQKEKITK